MSETADPETAVPVHYTTKIIGDDLIIYFKTIDINCDNTESTVVDIQKIPTILNCFIYQSSNSKMFAISIPKQHLQSYTNIISCNYDTEVDILNIYFDNSQEITKTLGYDMEFDIVFDGYEDTKQITYMEILFAKKHFDFDVLL